MKGKEFVSTRNPCKLCAPLGASIAFRGIEGCIPLVHGSQGCSTYIRRYGISHFREPIDIASSNFTESSAIFGGGENLKNAIANVSKQYEPKAIGIASTCLSETMGENIPMYLSQYEASRKGESGGPAIFYASTPSYSGTHMDGFHQAVFAAVKAFAGKPDENGENVQAAWDDQPPADARKKINILSGFVSTEDLREIRDIVESFGADCILVPDYSESLDGSSWETYQKLPEGGTKIADIRNMNRAAGTISFDVSAREDRRAGLWLEKEFGVPCAPLYLPVGIEQTDKFFDELSRISGNPVPEKWTKTRGRLIDAYIDGHKYCSGKRAIVYGEEDFVLALSAFLDEIGITPVVAATGAKNPQFAHRLAAASPNSREAPVVADDSDFETVLSIAQDMKADLIIGNSKGYHLARNLKLPLVRAGFPVHDRMGGQRILHLGYRGTLSLFDSVCNALMQAKQESAESGWTYI
ncbi:MAG: nitrogenase [Spirochaetales bacterium]|nr:nitrogenase [Spirochaetales bacterium]